jgi:hypothetical protein
LLYERHKAYFGQDDPDVLVIQGASTLFNPTLKASMIDRAMRDDPEAAGAEWNAEFRSDIDAFLDDRQIMAAIDMDRPRELPPRPGIPYAAFIDASGGRSDSYTMCIGHRHGDKFIADVVTGEPPPFNPSTVRRAWRRLFSPTVAGRSPATTSQRSGLRRRGDRKG